VAAASALVAQLGQLRVGLGEHVSAVDLDMVADIEEPHVRHPAVGEVAAHRRHPVRGADLDPHLAQPLQVRSGVPAVEVGHPGGEPGAAGHQHGGERHRPVPAQ